jgi:hypothetical protein
MAGIFNCDVNGTASALPHFWEHTVGSDHASMALRADWREQMRRAHNELGFRHVRFHGLLCDDVGTLISEGDTLFYSFFNADQIFDFLLSIGMKPFVELSFMPSTLASGDKTVFHYRANVTPPKDYAQWSTLIRKLVAHWIERYGLAEVRQWFFEVWNEPNLDAFGSGKQDDYFKLYRYTVDAIKSVDSALKVGGPATAANAWIDDFIAFLRKANCRSTLLARIIIRLTPSVSLATTPKRSFQRAGAACCATKRGKCEGRPATDRFITRNGVRLPIRVIRCMTSRMRLPSSSRPSWKQTDWFRAIATGPSPISSRKIIYRPCRFTAALACSTFTALPSPPIAPSNCCARLVPK